MRTLKSYGGVILSSIVSVFLPEKIGNVVEATSLSGYTLTQTVGQQRTEAKCEVYFSRSGALDFMDRWSKGETFQVDDNGTMYTGVIGSNRPSVSQEYDDLYKATFTLKVDPE